MSKEEITIEEFMGALKFIDTVKLVLSGVGEKELSSEEVYTLLEPYVTAQTPMKRTNLGNCPICGSQVDSYCPGCGQCIDWEDE